MADEADATQERMEVEEAFRRRQRTGPLLPPANGRCLYCSDPVDDGQHFCSIDCRQDWDKEQKIRKAQGLA